MGKTKKGNIFLLMLAILIAAVIYFLFMAETAVAPVPEKDFAIPSKVPSTTTDAIQNMENNSIAADILMYHHVGALPGDADDIRKGLTVSSEEFDKQLKYLSENKYKSITLNQLEKAIEDKKVPEKIVVLTFDDGYDDNYKEALPIMKKYNMVGTFFIITSKINTSEYMNDDQLKEIQKAGNELGSHTSTHPSLEKLKGASLEKELKSSKEKLEEISGQKITSLCYPAGKYNDDTTKVAKDVGYNIAVTTRASSGQVKTDQLLEVPRFRISANMSFSAMFR